MAFRVDPRRDLPPSNIEPSSYFDPRRVSSYGLPIKKAKKKQCHDWIFSSASNVHVALDRAAFKTYVAFPSYVLTVAEQRQLAVHGVGTVEIKIRREAGSKDSHTITLEDVLHVPEWMCNLVSDVYFHPSCHYEHHWTQFGVNFFVRDKTGSKPWGFTENFRGLDRLVLSRNLPGRSPMLEDPDREVFSVSVTWPQSQQDQWNELLLEEERRKALPTDKSVHFDHEQSPEDSDRLTRNVKSGRGEATDWTLTREGAAGAAGMGGMRKQSKSGLENPCMRGKAEMLPRATSLKLDG